MKFKRKRLTERDYHKLINCAIRLLEASWQCDKSLVGLYKRNIFTIVGVFDNDGWPYCNFPEPRWGFDGLTYCCKLMSAGKRIDRRRFEFQSKSEVYRLCRQFVKWIYAECERDPSKDRDDNQKGGSK